MSLVHFSLVNPGWKPPQQSGDFIAALREQVARDAEALPALAEEAAIAATATSTDSEERLRGGGDNALYASLHSASGEAASMPGTAAEEDRANALYSSMAGDLLNEARRSRMAESVLRSTTVDSNPPSGFAESVRGSLLASQLPQAHQHQQLLPPHPGLYTSSRMMLGATSSLAPPPNLRQDLRRLGLEYAAADMSLSALYLHELHQRSGVGSSAVGGQLQQQQRTYRESSRYDFQDQQQQQQQQRRSSLNELDEENLPLLEGSFSRLSSSNAQ